MILVAWTYCHVPHGCTFDMAARIEAQIERFAPGFRDRVLAHATAGPADLERHNPNYVGGDIGAGVADVGQFFLRPTWRTYSTPRTACADTLPPSAR